MPRRSPARPVGLTLVSLCLFSATLAAGDSSPGASAPVRLDPVTVLGSRIRRGGEHGATSVTTLDREMIAATGALRITDVLDLLPQNYTGASSGRGSAPNEFNPEFGVRTESLVPPFNFVLGAAAVPLGQSGVSGANLRGLGSGSTLVLIDGRRQPIAAQGNRSMDTQQGFVDLAAIPLGMVERIEVITDGASALYGSDAIGGAINIVLRRNYSGAELATDYRGTFDGGARERRAVLTAGLTSTDTRLRGMIALEVFDRAKLSAAQRAFSREQDHRHRVAGIDAAGQAVFGRDLRINWGYPAVVQARTGALNGVTNAAGAAVPVALVPEGARATPPPSGFVPGEIVPPNTAILASGQRRTSTAEFLALVPPQTTRHVAANFDYALTPSLTAAARLGGGEVRGRFDGQPPVSAASASTGFGSFSTLVPAIIGGQPNVLNPFGQDVMVGLIHAEFGSTRQETRTRTRSGGLSLAGTAANGWSWDASLDYAGQKFAQHNVTFDPARFTAALAAADAARRFNPFVDARAGGATHAALYADMASVDRFDGVSRLTTLALVAEGPLGEWRTRRPRLALGGNAELARHRTRAQSAAGFTTGSSANRESRAVFAELALPLFGGPATRPGLRRLEWQLAGRFEDQDSVGRLDPKIGMVWSPVRAWTLRAGYATGFRAPSLTEAEVTRVTFTNTVDDPRRTPASTPNVAIVMGARPDARLETSRHETAGVSWSPAFLKGLSLEAGYARTRQRNLLQSLAAVTLLRNESAFASRITRAAPTTQDAARNQPGAVTAIDASFVSFGETCNESLDLAATWDVPTRQWGRWRTSLAATHTLVARAALVPGAGALDLSGDTTTPPRWRGMGTVLWAAGAWSAAVFVRHVGEFESNRAGNPLAPLGTPSWTTAGLRVGYTFERGVARGMRVGLGIGNLFDREPPFADTVFGFNGGLHDPLGRTYAFSLIIPFGK